MDTRTDSLITDRNRSTEMMILIVGRNLTSSSDRTLLRRVFPNPLRATRGWTSTAGVSGASLNSLHPYYDARRALSVADERLDRFQQEGRARVSLEHREGRSKLDGVTKGGTCPVHLKRLHVLGVADATHTHARTRLRRMVLNRRLIPVSCTRD